jgi:hypothetical protein
MPVSKQRKSQKQKSVARTSRLKDDANRMTKKLMENYRKIMDAKNQSITPQIEE